MYGKYCVVTLAALAALALTPAAVVPQMRLVSTSPTVPKITQNEQYNQTQTELDRAAGT
jgi:hypothetical protein